MRYHGAITQYGNDFHKGSITVNTKTANAPPQVFKPWVTVDAFWSNKPPFPSIKPTGQGQYSFISYHAKLVTLLSIRKQDDFIVNVTGLWNIGEVKITTQFGQNGSPINTVREVTPRAMQATGQLLITPDWKKVTIIVDGADTLQGVEISMITTTNPMNPFSFSSGPQAKLGDLMQIMGSFRAIAGLATTIPIWTAIRIQKSTWLI
jgi:hypothetical protein